MGLRGDAGLGCGLLNLLPMFVEPCEEEYVAPTQAPVAGQDVGRYGGIGMPDMGHVVHVINRRRDVEAVGITHGA